MRPADLSDIRGRLKKKWKRGVFLTGLLRGDESLFPLRLPLRSLSASEMVERFDELRAWAMALRVDAEKRGLQLEWKQVNHRQLGPNEIPSALVCADIDTLSRFLGESRSLESFRRLSKRLLSTFPELKGWVASRPFELLRCEAVLDRLMLISGWIRAHPRPGIFLRELSLPGVDTKFVEGHRGILSRWLDILLPEECVDSDFTGVRGFEGRYGFRSRPELVRFRLPGAGMAVGGFTDLTVPVSEFLPFEPEQVDRVFITENDINGLTFPPRERTLVLFGRGYSFLALAEARILRNRPLFYWGDMDTHGFAILNQFRSYFPHAQSFLMDRETFLSHSVHWVRELSPVKSELSNLSPEESALYDDIRFDRLGKNLRLEQEFISFDLVKKRVEALWSP